MNNQKILKLIEKRLQMGAIEHGSDVPIDNTRDQLQDALEEALDLSVYLAAKILEINRRESKWIKLQRKITMTLSKMKPKSVKLKCQKWMNSLSSYMNTTLRRMK